MNIIVDRLKDDTQSTIGTMHINGKFRCFTLEDTFNYPKVYGKTRIPEGEYKVKLRNEGGMTQKYKVRFPDMHKGMLWLQDVDNFEWVYIHIGNNEDHTDGCVLVGMSCSAMVGVQKVSGSKIAYENIYPEIASAIENGEDVTIAIR